MRENALRAKWKSGGTTINGWLSIGNSFSAEVMAHQGWDSLTIDLQHGMIGEDMLIPMLQAISTTPTVPFVRVPWLDPAPLMRALDAGAYGIICPMISSRANAERLVAYTHYPPRGTRSFGPARGVLYGGADYAAQADATIVALAMIETADALDNLDDILSTPGLDGIYIGPSDLSLAMGCKPNFDDPEPKVVDMIEHIAKRAKAHGVVAGIHSGNPDVALKRGALGFQFLTAGADAALMAAGAKQHLAKMRGGNDAVRVASGY
jgi:4-hydroxy-2-oxoheptanedioate aldolase